jgi:hypothetical protein
MPKHRFVSAVADGPNAALVRPQSNWNDAHIFGISQKTGNYQLLITDDLIWVTAVATITMPNPSSCSGQPFRIQNAIAAGGTVTIVPYNAELFYYLNNSSGVPSVTLPNFAQFVELVNDGTNWWIQGAN